MGGQRSITTLSPAAPGPRLRGVVDDAQLHPYHPRRHQQGKRLVDDSADVLGGAEDVDHVDRLRQVGEASDHRHAGDVATGEARVDADTGVTAGHEEGGDFVGRPARIGREADDRDPAHRGEERAQIEAHADGILLPSTLKRCCDDIKLPLAA